MREELQVGYGVICRWDSETFSGVIIEIKDDYFLVKSITHGYTRIEFRKVYFDKLEQCTITSEKNWVTAQSGTIWV
ncbi:hypothetical protein A374_08834 [Fictibacillus macauensis ZFHKF-1]|uniref:Uncharacterized protein n=1 Tax=Fictibacillus macauensis ZFHKF-1 TaxID=1196324 RepID=I8UGH3_9BACL|nr:hypothetical protein [Fictibacillus macauensis]EIT85928.1 hypothetical protein A374_08834 [Fictibacillus macauensis ZFHKF-1]